MSDNRLPSMTALLGLLAVAGFQNRDKLASLFGGAGQDRTNPNPNQSGMTGANVTGANMTGANMGGGGVGYGSSGEAAGQPRMPSAFEGLLGGQGFGAGGLGGFLSSGLGELVNRFRQAGQGETAESWVRQGPNRQVAPNELEQALGPEVLETLTQKTGLSREELLERLSRQLPDAVDQYTPEGRIGSPA